MQLDIGSEVFTKNEEKIGNVDYVVLDPNTKEVTHFVVKHGFLLTEDKVVPVEWVDEIQPDRLVLRASEDKFEQLPSFEETHYVYLSPDDSPYAEDSAYWYPPVGSGAGLRPGSYPGYPVPPFVAKTEENIPDDVVPIEDGTPVFDIKDEHVGDIEHISIDPETKRATHFVISQGLLLKERKLVPTLWISRVSEDGVYLVVTARFLDRLPDYELA